MGMGIFLNSTYDMVTTRPLPLNLSPHTIEETTSQGLLGTPGEARRRPKLPSVHAYIGRKRIKDFSRIDKDKIKEGVLLQHLPIATFAAALKGHMSFTLNESL